MSNQKKQEFYKLNEFPASSIASSCLCGTKFIHSGVNKNTNRHDYFSDFTPFKKTTREWAFRDSKLSLKCDACKFEERQLRFEFSYSGDTISCFECRKLLNKKLGLNI